MSSEVVCPESNRFKSLYHMIVLKFTSCLKKLLSFVSVGGIGGAVCAAVSMEPNIVVHNLAVMDVPRSGRCNEALDFSGISSRHIIVAVKCILMT
jgi:hypothetical protein